MDTDTFITEHGAYELSRLAECYDPDTSDSPGAKFLDRVQDACNDARADADEDSAHEIADGAVPIYTHEKWLTFVDLGAYQEDPSDLGADSSDMDQCASVCLYMIAARLANELLAEEGDDDE